MAVALCAAVAAAPVASAADWSDLLREVRDVQRLSEEARPLEADEATRIWDAFLTAVLKQAGRDAQADELRTELFSVLLDDRYAVIATAATNGDGVRWLGNHFQAAWPSIEPVLERVAAALPPEQAQAYREFVQGGRLWERARDHGLIGDQAVSSDALRKLARKLVPESAGDPIAWSADVDPELRAVFGFDAELPTPVPSPLLTAPPTAMLPGPLSLLARMVEGAGDWLVPSAHAAASGWDWHTLVTRLNDWIPNGKGEMREYLPMVLQMLDGTAHTLADKRLPPEHFAVYRDLVTATAWQESCWRQYVKKAGQVAPIVGPGPSFGLMQINTRAWRGLYDAKGISSDIGYNGRAGAEILYQYMRRHAIRGKEHLEPGGDTNLARATYAAYNGGPGHLRRYRKPTTSARLRAVDNEFWQKFQAVEKGNDSAFFSCAVKG